MPKPGDGPTRAIRIERPPTAPSAPGPTCASVGLAAFPWPDAPQPSDSTTIPRRLLFGQDLSPKTLADVGAKLERSIADAGYRTPRFLAAGCNGFAIMLDLEHIRDNGARLPGEAGFAPPGQDETFNLASWIQRLFHAPPGQYRQIVFVVSEQLLGRTTPSPSEDELRAIARAGRSALPRAFAAVPYTTRTEVTALIYEFEKGPRDGDARVIPPDGRLRAATHLQRARLP